MQNFKQNAAALQYWSDMFQPNSRNIVDPTQLIGYDSDQKVHTNNNFYYFLLEVFSLYKIVIFCSWNASITVFMRCCFLRFLGWKWKCMRDRRKLSFSFPTPRTGVSFRVLLSRDFSWLPQWRACPQANLGSIIKAVEQFKPGEFLFLATASWKDRGSIFFLKELKIQKIHGTLQPFFLTDANKKSSFHVVYFYNTFLISLGFWYLLFSNCRKSCNLWDIQCMSHSGEFLWCHEHCGISLAPTCN